MHQLALLARSAAKVRAAAAALETPPALVATLTRGGSVVHVTLRGQGAALACSDVSGALASVSPYAPRPRCRAVGAELRVTFPTGDLSLEHAATALERAAAMLAEHGAQVTRTDRPSAAKPRERDPLGWVGKPPPEGRLDLRPYVAEALTAWAAPVPPGPPRAASIAHEPFTFWTGTHEASWLGRTTAPLFVSRRRFYDRTTERLTRTLPRALGPWALDSGGFTEVAKHGQWRISGKRYLEDVRRLQAEVGNLRWAAPQDWMVEPDVVKKTGLSIALHQQLTTYSIVALRMMAPDVPIVPVLQGWTMDDYLRHRDAYAAAGIDLAREPLVGVGTMCRRTECPSRIANMLRRLRSEGVTRMHAFGDKTEVLARGHALQDRRQGTFEPLLGETNGGLGWLGDILVSADSLAWSQAAFMHAQGAKTLAAAPMIPGHVHGQTNCCNNCLEWALVWRRKVLDGARITDPPGLFWRGARAGEDRPLPEGRWSLG